MNKRKNLSTGEGVKRLFTDEELDQTFSKPEKQNKKIIKEKEDKPNLNIKETIALKRPNIIIRRPIRLDL